MKQDLTALNQRRAKAKIQLESSEIAEYLFTVDTMRTDYLEDIAAGEFDDDIPLLKEFATRLLEI